MKIELNIERVLRTDENFKTLNMNNFGANVEDGVIHWTYSGSSSCPPIIVKATFDDVMQTVTLIKANYSGRMCTADMNSVHQIISLPDSGKIPEDYLIEIVS